MSADRGCLSEGLCRTGHRGPSPGDNNVAPVTALSLWPLDKWGARRGARFSILLDSGLLKPGSPVVRVRTTKGRIPVFLDGQSTTEPYLVADCIELWKPDTKQLIYCAPRNNRAVVLLSRFSFEQRPVGGALNR